MDETFVLVYLGLLLRAYLRFGFLVCVIATLQVAALAGSVRRTHRLHATSPDGWSRITALCANLPTSHRLRACMWWLFFYIRSREESVSLTIFGEADSRPRDSFASCISHWVFQCLFARCWIGARTAPTEIHIPSRPRRNLADHFLPRRPAGD